MDDLISKGAELIRNSGKILVFGCRHEHGIRHTGLQERGRHMGQV